MRSHNIVRQEPEGHSNGTQDRHEDSHNDTDRCVHACHVGVRHGRQGNRQYDCRNEQTDARTDDTIKESGHEGVIVLENIYIYLTLKVMTSHKGTDIYI